VRTRRPGDRVRQRAREISLKRFLMARRVSAFDRPGLPLVASGREVLWVPGQPAPTPGAAAPGRFVRVRFESDSRLHQERA